ncbi:MAG: hypothetical protein EA422_09660 [Gemmatimonadales bacterium]|nr:MAG: hypothetical protein EA422_09660 [Gemmatimonadales bacterium]
MALILAPTGCDFDRILQVDDPDTAQFEDIDDPANLPVFRAHAVGETQVAYAGRGAAQDNSFILLSGLLSDEYEASGTFLTRVEVDRRSIQATNATVQTTYRLMHRARLAAIRADRAYQRHAPAAAGQAEAQALVGLMMNAFGEMFCSGQPFSELTSDGEFIYGAPLTTGQVFAEALQWYGAARATAAAAGAQRMEHLASVGLARAHLNRGEFQEAAAVAATVPTDFEYAILHDGATARQWNGTWNFVNSVKRWRIPDAAGGNGLPYRSLGTEVTAAGELVRAGDSRVVWFEDGRAFDAQVTQFSQLRFPDREAPTPVATGVEARLIEAEAALRRGDQEAFLRIHNDLRLRMDGLEPFTREDLATLTSEARVDLHFQERALWLWQTGHRLGDLRRLIRQYDRAPDQVFPSQVYHKGGAFGPDVNFPVPVDEENNPSFQGCFDRGA